MNGIYIARNCSKKIIISSTIHLNGIDIMGIIALHSNHLRTGVCCGRDWQVSYALLTYALYSTINSHSLMLAIHASRRAATIMRGRCRTGVEYQMPYTHVNNYV